MTDYRCRVSEEDARDSHFDGLTDAEEGRAIQTHIDRRETLRASIASAQEKLDKLLNYAEWHPDPDDIESAEELNLGLDWHLPPNG